MLPEDKPRLMHGVCEPHEVLQAVRLGVDILDSSYPYVITERGGALVFEFKETNQEGDTINNTGGGDSVKKPQGTSAYEIKLSDKR